MKERKKERGQINEVDVSPMSFVFQQWCCWWSPWTKRLSNGPLSFFLCSSLSILTFLYLCWSSLKASLPPSLSLLLSIYMYPFFPATHSLTHSLNSQSTYLFHKIPIYGLHHSPRSPIFHYNEKSACCMHTGWDPHSSLSAGCSSP